MSRASSRAAAEPATARGRVRATSEGRDRGRTRATPEAPQATTSSAGSGTRERATSGRARRAAQEAAATRRARVAGTVARRGAQAATAPSFAWQRIVREEDRAARAHRDEVRAALHELDRHLDMGDALTRRLTLFPGCPIR